MQTKLFLTVSCCALAAALLAASPEAWRPSATEMKAWNRLMGVSAERNAVFSPAGFVLALGVLGEGTGGDVRRDVAETIGILADFSSTFSGLTSAYAAANASNRVALSVSTSLWMKRLRDMSPDYRRTLLTDYRVECGPLALPYVVNAFTEAKTEGRVTNVVSEIAASWQGLLVNAVAFEGAWLKPFDPRRTKTAPFTRADGSRTSVRTFGGDFRLVRIRDKQFRAVRVPFAAPNCSMILLLPEKDVDVAAIRQRFADDATLMDGLKTLFRAESGDGVEELVVSLTVPEMEIDSRWNAASALGAFKVPLAGFTRIGGDFRLDELRLAAWIRVTEKDFSLQPGVVPPPKKKPDPRPRYRRAAKEEEDEVLGKAQESFTCDRPFLFLVWDENTDTLLLAGQFTGR